MATKGYQHLTLDQRCQIYALLKRGHSKAQIAEDLNVHRTTVGREIRRNMGKRGYRHKQADEKAINRRSLASQRPKKMTPELISIIREKLTFYQWSPEQITGWLKQNTTLSISHECIYQYIVADKKTGGILYLHLRRKKKKYNKRIGKTAGRGLIPGRIDIDERPEIVNAKERVGDFEIDTVIGKNHQGAIVTMVERKTKLTKLVLIQHKTEAETSEALISALDGIKQHVTSLTADNGKEFAGHRKVAQALDAIVYFAKPYHSWERGLNENTNGLVRQYFPKKTDFTKLTYEEVRLVENKLNNRPRKTLNFQTPIQSFLALTGVALHC